jgi:hypothetical protein
MAKLTIEIPDSRVQDVLDAFGYSEIDHDNPADFMRDEVIRFVKDKVTNHLKQKEYDKIEISDINIT